MMHKKIALISIVLAFALSDAAVLAQQEEEANISKAYPILYFVGVTKLTKPRYAGDKMFNEKGQCTHSKTVGYLFKDDLDYVKEGNWEAYPNGPNVHLWNPSRLRALANGVRKRKLKLSDEITNMAKTIREVYQKTYPDKLQSGKDPLKPLMAIRKTLEFFSCETLADVLVGKPQGSYEELKNGSILLVKEDFESRYEILLEKMEQDSDSLRSAMPAGNLQAQVAALEDVYGKEMALDILQIKPEEEPEAQEP